MGQTLHAAANHLRRVPHRWRHHSRHGRRPSSSKLAHQHTPFPLLSTHFLTSQTQLGQNIYHPSHRHEQLYNGASHSTLRPNPVRNHGSLYSVYLRNIRLSLARKSLLLTLPLHASVHPFHPIHAYPIRQARHLSASTPPPSSPPKITFVTKSSPPSGLDAGS